MSSKGKNAAMNDVFLFLVIGETMRETSWP